MKSQLSLPLHRTECHVVFMTGKHAGRVGRIKGTWVDHVEAARRWGTDFNSKGAWVHGVLPVAIKTRFRFLREATALEIGLFEQECERA